MSDDATRDANMNNRIVLIQRYHREMTDIEIQRKELNERSKELRESIKDAGLIVKALDDHRRLLKVAEKSPEAADEYIDARREAFRALPVGEQADFLADLDAAAD